jgi:hypothetical protein
VTAGVEVLAAIAMTGRLLGLGPGDEVASFDERFALRYVEESGGKGASRTVRRDYGLFEAAFEPSRGMRCSSLLVEVHRLAADDGLPPECRSVEGVELPRFVTWSEVQACLERVGSVPADSIGVREGDFVRYRLRQGRTVVHVLDDPSAGRGVLPGHGDVWSMDLT